MPPTADAPLLLKSPRMVPPLEQAGVLHPTHAQLVIPPNKSALPLFVPRIRTNWVPTPASGKEPARGGRRSGPEYPHLRWGRRGECWVSSVQQEPWRLYVGRRSGCRHPSIGCGSMASGHGVVRCGGRCDASREPRREHLAVFPHCTYGVSLSVVLAPLSPRARGLPALGQSPAVGKSVPRTLVEIVFQNDSARILVDWYFNRSEI
ncbi:hypothetical protein B0H13DRAFT_1924986 [Mycena leptocephala]|nr:hypothetical protein B0H13DRAFT_1924986 [Mycena leptocephala]